MIATFGTSPKTRFLSLLEGIHTGQLELITPEGTRHRFGSTGKEVTVEIRDWSLLPLLMSRGDIGLGEGYVGGLWDSSSVEDLVTLTLQNYDLLSDFGEPNLWNNMVFRLSNAVVKANSLRGAGRNIRAHYDVGNEFYQLWLDRGMTYSSAIFVPGETDLERAQTRKYDRILSRLSQGEQVLEIGCGWGGFAERAADEGRRITGITLSPSQKGFADARLDGRADIRLQDYRATQGRFDNIVSIEMIEAVGERYWPVYFSTLKARLAETGRAVIQSITVPDAEFSLYRKRSDFIRHYTFPGGMLPCEAAITRHAREAGLSVRDRFAFGQDYARTCRMWRDAFQDRLPRLRKMGYGQRFLRSWEYYLGSCAAVFATGTTDVMQIELAHDG